jgi:SOS-response transcriptional repressor LexA
MVRVRGGTTVLVEIKGGGGEIWAPDQIRAKNAAAQKWVAAVNNLGTFGKWAFEICRDLNRLEGQIAQHAVGARPLPFYRIDEPRDEERFSVCVPLVELHPAAGLFSEEQVVQASNPDWGDDWVRPTTNRPLKRGMFVAQVNGRSMEPDVPDGSYCLFGPAPEGTRQGRTVLVWMEGETDPEHGGHYTIKRYQSEKIADPDGTFRHTKITLQPRNPAMRSIVLTPEAEGQVRVLAELLDVLA